MSADVDCVGKTKFRSFNRAARVAKRQGARHKGERYCAYHCRYCNFFHTGSALKSEPTPKSIDIATQAEWEELDFIERSSKQ